MSYSSGFSNSGGFTSSPLTPGFNNITPFAPSPGFAQQSIVPQQTGGYMSGTSFTSVVYGANNFGGSPQGSFFGGSPLTNSMPLVQQFGNAGPLLPFGGPNNIGSYSAGPTTQNSLNPDMVKTGMGGKSLLSANAFKKQIDDAYADGDKFSDKAHNGRLELNRLGEEISYKLREQNYGERHPKIMELRSKFAQLEKEVALNDDKAAQAYKRASTATTHRNNALDGVAKETNPTTSTNPFMQFLNQLMAFLFGTNDKQNLETVMGGGNRLAEQEYSQDIDKATKRRDGYQAQLDAIRKEKADLGNEISALENRGVPRNHLFITSPDERWHMLGKEENRLQERIDIENRNIKTAETKRDTVTNANVLGGDSIARNNNAALLGG